MGMPSLPQCPWGQPHLPILYFPHLMAMYEVVTWPSLGDMQRASWRKELARSRAGRECSGKRWHSSPYLSVWLQGHFFLSTPSLHFSAQPSFDCRGGTGKHVPKLVGLNSWKQALGLHPRAKWPAVPGPSLHLQAPLAVFSSLPAWLLSPGLPPSCSPVEVRKGTQSLGQIWVWR